MQETQSVLIVDDDAQILKLVSLNLQARGYAVKEAKDGAQALALFERGPFDLIILDLVMPGIDGIQVCTLVRERSDVPIIVLSAYDEEELKVRALDAGADDYVTKPFSVEELLARMRALRRRTLGETASGGKVIIGDLVIDLGARRAFLKDEDMRLTRTEFALLSELAQHQESVLTHDELLDRVWGPEYKGSSHYLHVYLGRIRKKMGAESSSLLETIPGVGYILHSSH